MNDDRGKTSSRMERLYDNPWLLLLLGFLVPFLSYYVWGWVEILLMKDAALP